ncbi:hypothetical protein NLI96_g2155 [Meripilus lineatus]|uniref:Uncharacterized protein n=1 Tax=Meripilus lineatus TaxID=2056292 RepID=A0AAD5YM90_9APHY|nr:hypothetical protein NLI96_g2155 [Physisporinus lineatus]
MQHGTENSQADFWESFAHQNDIGDEARSKMRMFRRALPRRDPRQRGCREADEISPAIKKTRHYEFLSENSVARRLSDILDLDEYSPMGMEGSRIGTWFPSERPKAQVESEILQEEKAPFGKITDMDVPKLHCSAEDFGSKRADPLPQGPSFCLNGTTSDPNLVPNPSSAGDLAAELTI